MTATKVKQALKKMAKPDKAAVLAHFFKTGPGQYGAGDLFLGITVPEQRAVAKRFTDLPLIELKELLASPYHEHRLTALLILTEQFKRASEADQRRLLNFYLKQTCAVNNWDLVDLTADKIVGSWLVKYPDRKLLSRLANSANLWERRIAVVATYAFIRRGQVELIMTLAKKFIKDREDLIHKAVGWMLREAGQRDQAALKKFLNQQAGRMPRVMLRYALEKMSDLDRRRYLRKKYVAAF